MNILLTGGTGFIGKNFVNLLVNTNHSVLVLTRSRSKKIKNINFLRSNLNLSKLSLKKIKKFKPSIKINLAWEGIPNFGKSISQKNKIDQINFFKKILTIKEIKKVISIGSCWEYKKKGGLCKESDKTNSKTYFTKAKLSIRSYIEKECKIKNINFLWFRLFYVFGPYQRKGSLIPFVIKQITKNKSLEKINLKNQNDFIYVNDCCKIIYYSIKKKMPSGIYNIGSGNLTSVYEIVSILLKFFKKKKLKCLNKFNNSVFASTSKLKRYIKYKNKTKINNDVIKTIKYYE